MIVIGQISGDEYGDDDISFNVTLSLGGKKVPQLLEKILLDFKNKIHKIQASLKRKFDTKKSCAERLQYYTDVVHERLSKTKKIVLRTKEHKIYLDNNNEPRLSLWGLCPKDPYGDLFIAFISLEDWLVREDISKEGL